MDAAGVQGMRSGSRVVSGCGIELGRSVLQGGGFPLQTHRYTENKSIKDVL